MSEKEKILIVDDDENTCKTLSLIFIKEGYEVETALTAHGALEKIRERSFNLALLDIKLPDMDGIELLPVLKKHQSDMMIIMITGHASVDTAVDALNTGASAYIIKPMEIDQVLIMVRDKLEKQRLVAEKKKAEEKLRESEEKYCTLFKTLSDAVFVIDQETGQIIDVNNAAILIYGYNREEWLNMKNIDVSAEVDETRKATQDVPSHIPVLYHKKIDGTIFPVEMSVSSFMHKGRRVVIATSHDITNRMKAEKTLKQSEERFRQFFENEPSYCYMISTDGNILNVNKAALNALGYKKEELINKPLKTIYAEELLPKMEQVFEKWKKTGKTRNEEFKIITKKGAKRIVILNADAVRDMNGKILHSISVQQDITERKIMEKELILAKEKAEEADKLKMAFLANMSHEIRTPMNAIVGFTDLITSPDITEEQKTEFGRIINENSYRLLHLVDDILDISKIESGQLEISKVDYPVNKVLDDLITFFTELKSRNGKEEIEIRLNKKVQEDDFTFIMDPLRLQQILSNLIDNALKYTEAGFIEIGYSIQPAAQAKKKKGRTYKDRPFIKFYVKDTGVGIPEDHIEYIFDRFRKVEDKTKLYGGAGLGLTISKNLVNMMGGEMWVESVPGKGSTFYFTLPFEPPDKISKDIGLKDKIPEKYKWTDNVILIAEDEESNYALLEHILKKTQVQLLWAKDGKETVDICRSNKNINLILMDIKMPEMDGYTATRLIKKFRKDLPVIAITAYAAEKEEEECSKAGCDDYLPKPIKYNELLRLINKYIEPGRGKDERMECWNNG